MSPQEIALLTEMSARLLGQTFTETDTEAKMTYAMLVKLVNKVLLIAKNDGIIKGKSDILGLLHRGYLLWTDYQSTKNVKLVSDLKEFVAQAESLLAASV